MGLILLIVLVLLLVGAIPTGGYGLGNNGLGGLGLVLVVILILIVLGVVPFR